MPNASDGIMVKSSPINERGVFATRDFRQGETVVPWSNTHEISPAEHAILPPGEQKYIEMQCSRILLVGEPERYVNHSCAPNTASGKNSDVALRDIATGEEITTDYGNFFIPGGSFNCTCGNSACRKTITGRTPELHTAAIA